jgi:hypothetical protein
VISCVVVAAALLLGWNRVASVGFLTLAVAVLPCGVACAVGIWLLDRRKGAGNCRSGEGKGAISKRKTA